MNYTVRVVSLLRWTIVAVHTALVISVFSSPVLPQMTRSERAWTRGVELWLLLADLPVVILTVLPGRALFARELTSGVLLGASILLGGLQWYLIASLLARMTFGFQRSIPIASKRFGLVLVAGLVLVGVCAALPWIPQLERVRHPRVKGRYAPPGVAFEGNSADLHQSVVVPTLETLVPEGKNVIWCGTMQLAWNRLGEDVLNQPPNVTGAETVALRLNEARFGDDDLPVNSYLAVAGFVKDGIVDTVNREMASRFNKVVEIDPLEANDILAYAYLEARTNFTLPYFDSSKAFRFLDSTGKETQVASFGIEEKHEYAYDHLREQVDVLYRDRDEMYSEPEEFVLDLCRFSSPNQLIVARIPREATLAETLADMEKKTRDLALAPDSEHYRRFGPNDVLIVPNLNWEVQHRFTELEGPDRPLLNDGFGEYYIAKAMQTIRFRLDRSGAELASEAQLPCAPVPTHYLYNRPFLIVMKQRGAERPFFLMWVDNAELLSKP